MTVFTIVAALLLATALLFILPPLLRKDPAARVHVQREELNLTVLRDQLRELDADLESGVIEPLAYESARHELERRVAEEVQPGASSPASGTDKRWVPWVSALAVPVISIALYVFLGTPSALDPAKVAAANEKNHEVTPEQIENMVQALAQRLKNTPDDVEGWNMLARSYNALGRFADAANAYSRLVELMPNNADVLADYADTLAMATNKSLQGEPEKIVDRALAIDSKNIKALALSGSAAFERRDYANAAARWQKIMAIVPPDSDIARSTQGSINEAQSLAGQTPGVQAAAANAAQPAAAGGAKVEGTVELDPSLRSQVSDSDSVFIFARAAEGPRFPLAVVRKQVKDLPAAFVLDDSMSMMPDAKLSSFPLVVLGARISKSGNATPSPGDFEGVTEPLRPGAKGVKIRINSRHN